jgi:hypothetical protein
MPHVPDNPVVRRVEHGVKRDGQLDNAKPRAEMAACDRDGLDHFSADFFRDLFQLLDIKRAQGRRIVYPIQQRRAVVRLFRSFV